METGEGWIEPAPDRRLWLTTAAAVVGVLLLVAAVVVVVTVQHGPPA